MAKRPNPTPAWLRWIVFAFIIYAGYLHFMNRNAETTANADNSQATTGATRQADTVVTSPPGVTISGDIAGTGDPASCGQTAQLDVTGNNPNGTPLEGGSGPVSVAVGVPQKDKAWAPAVSGMKKGGVREVTLSATQVFGKDNAQDHGLAPNDLLRFKLELKDLTPSTTSGTLPFRASDILIGHGNAAQCGDKVRFHLEVWNADGTAGYSSKAKEGKPLEMTVGEATYFYGLDRGLVNMRVGSLRSLIVPPSYLASTAKPTDSSPLKALPRDKTLLVDLQLLEIVDTAPSTK